MTIPSTTGKRIRWALSLVIKGIAVWVISVGLLISWASWRQGYDWNEMDWNNDGSTSISEFLTSSDVGRRSIVEKAIDCVEYYSMKDGMTIKIVCPTISS